MQNRALGDLTTAIEKEMEEELKEIVQMLSSIVNRCYAIYACTRYDRWYNRDLFRLNIPSLVTGQNLFDDPSQHYRLEDGEQAQNWKTDPDAVNLFEQLQHLGQTHLTLQRMEKNYLDANVGD